jgi:hypothetical protein
LEYAQIIEQFPAKTKRFTGEAKVIHLRSLFALPGELFGKNSVRDFAEKNYVVASLRPIEKSNPL